MFNIAIAIVSDFVLYHHHIIPNEKHPLTHCRRLKYLSGNYPEIHLSMPIPNVLMNNIRNLTHTIGNLFDKFYFMWHLAYIWVIRLCTKWSYLLVYHRACLFDPLGILIVIRLFTLCWPNICQICPILYQQRQQNNTGKIVWCRLILRLVLFPFFFLIFWAKGTSSPPSISAKLKICIAQRTHLFLNT